MSYQEYKLFISFCFLEGDFFLLPSRPKQPAILVKGEENLMVTHPIVEVFMTDYMYVITVNFKTKLLSVKISFIVPFPLTTLLFIVFPSVVITSATLFVGFNGAVINGNLKVWVHRQTGEIRT